MENFITTPTKMQKILKLDVSESLENQEWKAFIPARDEVLIGGLTFLKDWIIRSETSDALDKLFIKNISTGIEEELIFSDEKNLCSWGYRLLQRNRDTDEVYLGYSSPKNSLKSFIYNNPFKRKIKKFS